MRSLKLSLLSLGLVAGVSTSAAAQQVNFEDVATVGGFLSNPYAGYNWDNSYIMDPFVGYGAMPTGLATVVSGSRVLLNGGGQSMGISGSTFNLLSGDFAAAWTNGLNLNVKGYSEGNLLYNQDYLLNWSGAQNLQLDLFGVDNVVFSSFGGTVDPSFAWDSNQSFAADNLEFGYGVTSSRIIGDGDIGPAAVVPEPMTVSLMAAGLLVLGGVQARRRRASVAR